MSKVNIVESMSCVAIICSNLFIFIHLSLTQSPYAGASPATQLEIYLMSGASHLASPCFSVSPSVRLHSKLEKLNLLCSLPSALEKCVTKAFKLCLLVLKR